MPAHAIATSGTAAIAPEPSPSRISRSSSGRLPSALQQRRCPASALQWPTWQWSSAPGHDSMQRQRRRRDHIAVEQHRDRRRRAATIAAAIATSSAPPTSRSTSNGSRCRRCARRPRARPRVCAPVPRRRRRCRVRPTLPMSPPLNAATTAAAAVVLPMPISPRTRRSASTASTASRPAVHASSNRPTDIAGSKRMSPVGRPTPTSIA